MRHGVKTAEGQLISEEYVVGVLDSQVKDLAAAAGEGHKFESTADYLRKQITGKDYTGFLTE